MKDGQIEKNCAIQQGEIYHHRYDSYLNNNDEYVITHKDAKILACYFEISIQKYP